MPSHYGFDPEYQALKDFQTNILKRIPNAPSKQAYSRLVKLLLETNKKLGIGGAGFTPLIKEGVTYVSNPANDMSTVPLIKNLRGSEQAAIRAQEGLNKLPGYQQRINAARPTGKVPGIKMGLSGAKTGAVTGKLGGATSLAGIGAVVGAGYLGAKAIQAASKKTKRLQDKLAKESTQIADNLINVLKQRREQGLSNKDLVARIQKATRTK